jgi:hypothetical protein
MTTNTKPYVFLQSNLGQNPVIDIAQPSSPQGALLDLTQKQAGRDSQLWQITPDPAGSGFFFIQNKVSPYVMDVWQLDPKQLVDADQNSPLDSWPQKQTSNDNQLWQFVSDPGGSGAFLIKSKFNGNVVDVPNGSTQSGTTLNTHPQNPDSTNNQLWQIVPLTYTKALFEFWTTNDDLRQDSGLSAMFFASQQQGFEPPRPPAITPSLPVKEISAPKLDNWSYAALPMNFLNTFLGVPVGAPFDPTKLLNSPVNPTGAGTCQLTLVQDGTGFEESSDEWHVGAIRITLANPGTTEEQLIYGDAGLPDRPLWNQSNSEYAPLQPPTHWTVNKANPTITLPLIIP